MGRIKCCKDCVPPKRKIGCHAHCEEYLTEKAELDAQREADLQKKIIAKGLYEERRDAVYKAMKRRGRSK